MEKINIKFEFLHNPVECMHAILMTLAKHGFKISHPLTGVVTSYTDDGDQIIRDINEIYKSIDEQKNDNVQVWCDKLGELDVSWEMQKLEIYIGGLFDEELQYVHNFMAEILTPQISAVRADWKITIEFV